MSIKATHAGTCQVCGRAQKLPGGNLSKHGYTVEWSCFMGTCWGADHQPFELSKDLIEQAIKRAQDDAKALRKEAVEVLKNPGPEIWYHCYGKQSQYSKYNTYYWGKVTLGDGWVEVDGKKERHHFYNTLTTPALQQANEAYAAHLKGQAAKLDHYVQWQQERIKGWKANPNALKPIADERKGPICHLLAPHYGTWCAGSVMGGQRKMYRTDDPEKCTCARCIHHKAAYDHRQAAKASTIG